MSEKEPKKDEKELRAWMEPEFFQKLEELKEHYGLKNTTEIMRFIINKTHRNVFGQSPLLQLASYLKELFQK